MADKTHAGYENDLFEREIDVFPIEKYKGVKVKILHECLKGHQWMARPDQVLAGHGCAECYGNARKTLEQYNEQLVKYKITAMDYKSHRERVEHACDVCFHSWYAVPRDILADHGCPECAKLKHHGGYNATRFSRDRELANSPGILYVIVLVNKKTDERTCVKIGITNGTSNRDVLKRAAGFKGYEPRIQKLVHGTLEQVFNLEQELHKKWGEFQYRSEWKFGGYSELFNISKLKEILKSIPTEV